MSTPTPSPASAQVAGLAGELRVAVNRLAYALRRPGDTLDLTPSRYTALATLAKRGALRAGDLAEAMGIARPTMSRLADALVESGWVTRAPDPEDGRASLLTLSDAGRELLERLRREATADLHADIAALSEAERDALATALPALTTLAERQLGRARTGPAGGPA
ncbi:MarR family winged helix-turn-helix transcriptional regulator [Nocardioides panaciterrulae]|uniref:DNA-binding MarR family transcriptional regulator n=1 Tax=Nocardioides panaciterrulae TaxID=661492 RepID=A0A7Y9E9V1_9ACTN|nr:MarR family transcriptional regulator [Nocardioides panaciterrulae]NYD43591.1 DNA-binding MarR family transcriptional regulator [Nocardioides panaciterrulae]